MSKKVRGIVSLLLAFAMVLSLAACGGNPITETEAAETEAAAVETEAAEEAAPAEAEAAEAAEDVTAAAEEAAEPAGEGTPLKIGIITTSGVDDGNFWSIMQNGVDVWRDVGNGIIKSFVFGVLTVHTPASGISLFHVSSPVSLTMIDFGGSRTPRPTAFVFGGSRTPRPTMASFPW